MSIRGGFSDRYEGDPDGQDSLNDSDGLDGRGDKGNDGGESEAPAGTDVPEPDRDDSEESKTVVPSGKNIGQDNDHPTEKHSVNHPHRERARKVRYTSNIIEDLCRRSSVSEDDESFEMRNLITKRAKEYLDDLYEAVEAKHDKLPHPRKLLHYLAPKVPAIKHSPDISLRVHATPSDMSIGVSASIISTLARLCEAYDREMLKRATKQRPTSAAPDLTSDRRFEQLVECVLSGVNVENRIRELLSHQLTKSLVEDIETMSDEVKISEDHGLKVRDSCRVAWGMSVLGAHHLESVGGEKVMDVLLSLSLRTRDLLLSRLQTLRKGDLFSNVSEDGMHSTKQRINEWAEELAEDAVAAIWTFACVRACTGLKSTHLFETGCSILRQNPILLRKRAQEINENSEVANVGSNDIVDELAESETAHLGQIKKHNLDDSDLEPHRMLLDWLTPGEVSDIVWAIALHGGSGRSDSKKEFQLSETAVSLQNEAFSWIHRWLKEDIEVMKSAKQQQHSSVPTTMEIPIGQEMTTVEVVDAAALLASQSEEPTSSNFDSLPLDDTSLSVSNTDIHDLSETVDAAQILAVVNQGTDSENPNGCLSKSLEEETVLVYEKVAIEDDAKLPTCELKIHDFPNDIVEDDSNDVGDKSLPLLFSPRDLSSIAWAATELRGTLKVPIVASVVESFSLFGPSSLENLGGGDLSNLAWAMSRFLNQLPGTDRADSKAVTVARWIAHSSYEKINCGVNHPSNLAFTMLRAFQPPEIGRLMWSIATAMSTYTQQPLDAKDSKIRALAASSLVTAGSNLNLFATEDLMRISWAFLELRGESAASTEPVLAFYLGQILEIVEESLYRWEHVHSQALHIAVDKFDLANDVSLFSSFFGRPRNAMRHLDQQIADLGDDEILFSLFDKSHNMPTLKDLPVDPSTLCKVACCYARLSNGHSFAKESWTLTRVAMRLLTSKNAKLMREGSIHDIVRLCEAAVLSEESGQGKELVVGLFARKVLQVLNEVLDPSWVNEMDSPLQLMYATPIEISTLIWALGELGARHATSQVERQSAHRKMRLVVDDAMLSPKQIASLDMSSAARLLRGLVSMKFYEKGMHFVHDAIVGIPGKVEDIRDGTNICDLAEAVAALKEAIHFAANTKSRSPDKQDSEDTMPPPSATLIENNDTDLLAVQSAVQESPTETAVERPASSSIDSEILSICDEILRSLSTKSKEVICLCKTEEIRRILSVYSMLAFQADELVDAIEIEVERRTELAKLSGDLTAVQDMIRDAALSSSFINSTFFGDSHEESRFESIKNSLRSFFWSSEDNDESKTIDEHFLSEELKSMIHRSAALSSKASLKLEQIGAATRTSAGKLLQQAEIAVAFELGRCRELIDSYRLIDFEAGRIRSRYDKERRKDVAKRVLSRLLP